MTAIGDLPFWGMPGAYDEPDPFIWWIVGPLWAYAAAIVLAYNVAWFMERWKEIDDE